MKTKKLFSIFVIVLVAVLMLTAVMSTVTAVDAASKKVKVTWNADGGKIGTAKVTTTTIKQGVKIGKLPTTPKKTGYAFSGWYTKKKSGGTKITKNTKLKKSATYYAQWKRTLTAAEKKLIGVWSQHPDHGDWWYGNIAGYGKISGIEKIIPRNQSYNNMFLFKKDGTFVHTFRYLVNYGSLDATRPTMAGVYIFHGNFRITSDGKIVTSNVKAFSTTGMNMGVPKGWGKSGGRTYKFEYIPSGINVQVVNHDNSPIWQEYYKR
ncbi:MAG: InlB B-repeat-containing protein [Methanobrevibacter sp.]|nr:InlB B-repeat-containing protein [Methanobrevibacter sp.]